MVLIQRLSPTQVRVGSRTFSQQDFDIATTFLQRKLAGQRGTLTDPSGDFSRSASDLANLLRLDPTLQSAIESASRLRARALASGFESTEEFLQVSGAFARVPRTPTAPARTLTPQEQLLAITEGKGLTPTQLRLQKQLLQFPKELSLPDLPMSVRQDLSKQPSFAQRVIAGDIGEQVVGTRIRPQLLPFDIQPDVTFKEIRQFVKGKSEEGSLRDFFSGFIPITPLEFGIVGGTGLLLGGAGGKAAQLITLGVIEATFIDTAINEDLPTETRVAGGLLALAPLLIKLGIPKGKKGGTRFAILEEEILGKKVRKKKKVVDLEIALEQLRDRPDNAAKVQDIRNILREIAKTKDPKLRQQQLIEAKLLFEKAHGKQKARSLLKDFIKQEGLTLQKKIPVARRGVPILKAKETPLKLKEIKRVINAKTKQQERIIFSQKSLGERYADAQKLSPKEKQKLRQKIAVITRPTQLTKQAIAQAQAQRQLQKQAQRLKSATKLIQLTQPQLTFAQARAKARRQLARRGLFPIIPKPKPKLKAKRMKVKKKPEFPIAKQGYNVFGKPLKQKKFKRLNKTPLTKAKAKDLGAFLVDHSLSRTFKIKPTSKEAQKPKLKFPASYFSKTKHKFRDFKRVKGKKIKIRNTWIEKKGKPLLDTRAEKKKITLLAKLAKLKKKSRREPPLKPPINPTLKPPRPKGSKRKGRKK